jgi:hypothetical protein
LEKILLYFMKEPLVRIDVGKSVDAIGHNITAVEEVLFYAGLQHFLVDRDRFMVPFLQMVILSGEI